MPQTTSSPNMFRQIKFYEIFQPSNIKPSDFGSLSHITDYNCNCVLKSLVAAMPREKSVHNAARKTAIALSDCDGV